MSKQTDHRGYANTAFGKVRRIKTAYGWGVRACPRFSCKQDDVLFVIRNMVRVSPNDKAQWDGYTFKFDDNDDRRPSHNADDDYLHPPMMANTHCFEKNESFNIALFQDADIVVFEASRPISGGDMLIVDYGDEYNHELLAEREAARKKRVEDLANRVHLSHNYTCPRCGHTCSQKFRIRHFNKCGKEVVPQGKNVPTAEN